MDKTRPNENTLHGIGVSPGLAVGVAIRMHANDVVVDHRTIPEDDVEREVERIKTAIVEAKAQIETVRANVEQTIGKEEAQVFDAHLSFLTDPAYVGEMERRIQAEKVNAESVVETVTNATAEMLAALPTEYLQARADDIRDVGHRLLNCLIGSEQDRFGTSFSGPVILVANELMPSDLSTLGNNVVGLLTSKGSKTAHTAIMARTLAIPAVYGLGEGIAQIPEGDEIILDGDAGTVNIHVAQDILEETRNVVLRRQEQMTRAREEAQAPVHTRDGHRIDVFANIGGWGDVQAAIDNGADGVGLFRTEFLYLENDHWPTEEEQYEVYRKVLEAFHARLVVIRTLDIGGDKTLPYAELPTEENPFLGLRAIRYSLAEPDIFRVQLRALLRASAHGTLWIMFPMVETVGELTEAKRILNLCKNEVLQEGHTVSDSILVGIMVETPAAAVTADVLSKHADFFSIGTNDLTQYTLAADRGNASVAPLYDAAHPAVLRLIRNVCQAGQEAGIPVCMCGELAGDEQFTDLLVGLGVVELSMSSTFIPTVKQRVRSASAELWKRYALEAIRADTAEGVREYLRRKS